jgi:hypothetical protein
MSRIVQQHTWGSDDLIHPRKKTLTDLWREEWEKEFNLYERGNTSKKFKLI